MGNDEIGEAPRLGIRHRADPVSGHHVGVRLVDDERIGIRGAHPRQQAEIGAHLAGAETDRQIVLDLSRHEDAPTVCRDAGARHTNNRIGRGEIVFGDAAFDELRSEPLGAGEKGMGEVQGSRMKVEPTAD